MNGWSLLQPADMADFYEAPNSLTRMLAGHGEGPSDLVSSSKQGHSMLYSALLKPSWKSDSSTRLRHLWLTFKLAYIGLIYRCHFLCIKYRGRNHCPNDGILESNRDLWLLLQRTRFHMHPLAVISISHMISLASPRLEGPLVGVRFPFMREGRMTSN